MITDDDLAYFERWADAMETPTPGYSQDIQDDMKDRARRIRALVARVRELQARLAA